MPKIKSVPSFTNCLKILYITRKINEGDIDAAIIKHALGRVVRRLHIVLQQLYALTPQGGVLCVHFFQKLLVINTAVKLVVVKADFRHIL